MEKVNSIILFLAIILLLSLGIILIQNKTPKKSYEDNLGEYCEQNIECKTPLEYAVQSNCPFGSLCVENKCRVVCPLMFHDLNPEISKSYQYTCEKDKDCDCSERGERTIECKCLNGNCFSIEK